ncbi:hypothetical protein MTR67_019938, partial [Solanum verrucosum]
VEKHELGRELYQLASLGVKLLEAEDSGVTIQDTTVSSLVIEVKSRQQEDPSLEQLRSKAQNQQTLAFDIAEDEVLRYSGRLCVSNVAGLPHRIMEEAHHFRYSIHPSSTKMYHDIKKFYWWHGMKKDVVEFVAQCPNYQQVKVEHQKPAGQVHEIAIPLWKWEAINMDFTTGLPRSCHKFDSIWVIVNRLTKSSHFLPVRATLTAEDYAGLYIREIVRLHGDPSRVVPVEDVQITEELSYEETPVAILDRQVRKLRTKEVALVKVLWRNKNREEVTWEADDGMRSKYPHLFQIPG